MSPPGERPPRPVPDRTDVLVVLAVAFPTLMDAAWNQPGTRQADALTAVTALTAVGALLWRRRWPLPVTVLCFGLLALWYGIDHRGELLNLPAMVALYTVAVQGNRRRTITVGAVGSVMSGALTELTAGSVGSPALDLLWPLVPLALGEAVRAGHELAAERAEAERLRVARDVHDVVAHTMAAVTVHMEVAVEAFDSRPDAARRALVQARASSREALRELRGALTLLRDGEASAPWGLAAVDALAASARSAGVAVDLSVTGTRTGTGGEAPLPPAVDQAAYRIVQEALTNVVRHAGPTHATVSIGRSPTTLTIEVTDTGPTATADDRLGATDRSPVPSERPRTAESLLPGPDPDPGGPAGASRGNGGPGHGLVGMGERVAALGGRLTHGPRAEGGYRVLATLPAVSEASV